MKIFPIFLVPMHLLTDLLTLFGLAKEVLRVKIGVNNLDSHGVVVQLG